MIAVLKGDIIASRNIPDAEKWLKPLQTLLNEWGKSPQNWELVWGDFFQLEIAEPADALIKALRIKALIKTIPPADTAKTISPIDVRMAIGFGEKYYSGKKISESNGPAFINAGEKFPALKKERTTLAVKSPWNDFDEEINLYLKLACLFMDNWSISSAELIKVVLAAPALTQAKIGKHLGIKQSGVSGRWNRANADEILAVERMFRQKLNGHLL